MNLIWLVVKTIGSLFVVVCALRAYLQVVRLHPQNPVSRVVFRMTDWIVMPIRRIVPGLGGFDWASLLAALLLSLALVVAYYLLASAQLVASGSSEIRGSPIRPLGWLVALACVWLAQWSVQLAVVLLIVSVLFSWFNPVHPLKPVLEMLVEPMLLPFRRLLARLFGSNPGIDLSPIGAFLMLQITAALLAEIEAPVMRHVF